MKKRVIVFASIFVILMSITALCSEDIRTGFVSVMEPMFEVETDIYEYETDLYGGIGDTYEEMTEPAAEEVVFNETIESYMEQFNKYVIDNEFEENDRKKLENRFINTITDYKMTEKEFEHVSTLINDNYDIEKVLDIYEFLRWTNSDVDMIVDIYIEGGNNSDKKFWIYDTYDKINARYDDMLSVDDVAYYVGRGLTVDEIAGAYELSFAGIKTTKAMLNERLDGKTWNEISADIISENPDEIKNASEMTIDEVMYLRAYSVKTRKDVSKIAELNEGKLKIKDDIKHEQREKHNIKQNLIKKYDAEPKIEMAEEKKPNYHNKNTVIQIDELYEELDGYEIEEAEVE